MAVLPEAPCPELCDAHETSIADLNRRQGLQDYICTINYPAQFCDNAASC